MDMAATLCLMGFFLLLAKGWTLTSRTVHQRAWLVPIFAVFSISYVAFYVWENMESDEMKQETPFDSVPGKRKRSFKNSCLVYA